MKHLYILVLLLFTSCNSPSLSVRTLYGLTSERASVQEDTPDPLKSLLGRQHILSIDWSAPHTPSPTLDLAFRFEDEAIIHKTLSLNGTWGRVSYDIDQALMREHGTLLAYRIVLLSQGKEIACSEHKLWVDPIDVK